MTKRYTVYTVTNTVTGASYTGYMNAEHATSPQSVIDTFVQQADKQMNEQDADRVDTRFWRSCITEGATLNMSATVVTNGASLTEVEAFVLRNKTRAVTKLSVSGPSVWPHGIHERALADCGSDMERIKQVASGLQKRTAREAYSDDHLWEYPDVCIAGAIHGSDAIKDGLANMDPHTFNATYFNDRSFFHV